MTDETTAPAEGQPEAAPVETPAAEEPELPQPGGFVDVVDGEHKGRVGHFMHFTADAKAAVVRTRDEFNQLIVVLHKHLRLSKFTGGR